MKKTYESPMIDIERFFFEDVLTSSGLGYGDGAIDTLDGVDSDEGFIVG